MSELRRTHERTVALMRDFLGKLTGGWAPHVESAVPADDLLLHMRQAAAPSYGFFLMLAFAAAIAVLGLLGNSAPAIIGAMIIAPLMVPIMSLSYGMVILDRPLILKSAITITIGTIVVVAIAFASVFLFGMRVMGSEILDRTAPTLLDLGVALAAGGAAAFVHTRSSIANSIAGVAIAVALVPPLAVAGIGLALGRKAVSGTGVPLSAIGLSEGGFDIAIGAFLLFLTNLIGIVAVAIVVFAAQRYGNWKKASLALGLFVALTLVLVPPLKEAMHQLWVKNRVLRIASLRAAERPSIGRSKITSVHVTRRNGVLHVRIDGFIVEERLKDMYARVEQIREIVSADVGEPVGIELNLIPVQMIKIESKSENSKPGADGG
jgi:uncharacterized hydrophobic protein (TIGR00271 family)